MSGWVGRVPAHHMEVGARLPEAGAAIDADRIRWVACSSAASTNTPTWRLVAHHLPKSGRPELLALPTQENRTMPIFSKLPANNLDEISHVIQVAVAPVFLLTAVGTLLVVLTNRLGRSVDRRRVLERFLEEGAAGSDAAHAETELVLVGRRVVMIYKAIVLAVFCALFICILIALAFVDAFLASNLARGLGVLFVLAMIALIGSLVMFLREIFLAVSTATRASRAR